MKYSIEIKPQAIRDLADLQKATAERVLGKIERLENGLAGDVKKLTNYDPGYRLRVGDYRVLFDVEGTQVIVYRVLHRREAYDR